MILERLRAGWLVALLLLSYAAAAQAVLHKDLKKDFGALGNGRANDHAAFVRAADFFNQRAKTPAGVGRAVLHIPAGVYRVGQPGPSSLGNVLSLVGCRNLSIVGADSATTEIRYADSLRYGAFDPTTHAMYESPKAYFTDWSWGVGGGIAVALQDCDNVQVANLTLNGNSEHLLVGGHWGDTGIQLDCDGVFIRDSRHVRLNKLAVHHFGRDGIQVFNRLAKKLDDPAQEDILLENSRFDYNGRQGLSITGANGLRAINCSFSHTGRVVIPALGRPLYSNPGAGVDIEPEGGYVANVRLEGCRFVDNAGQGVVSDRYGNGPPTTKNIVIRNCLLWGVTNWSAWVRQTDFLFENCRIYGAFVTGCALGTLPTRFVGCTFEDRPYHGQPAYGQHLVYSNQEARAMRFTNCRFVGTRNGLLYAAAVAADSASAFRLHGCALVLDQAEPPLGVDNLLTNAVFSGNTTVESSPQRVTPALISFRLGTLEAEKSVAVRPGGQLRLLAPGCRYLVQNGLAIGLAAGRGAATVEVGSENELVLCEQPGRAPELYIGPASRLVVRRGGRLHLQPHTKVTIAGKLTVEAGAYFEQDASAEVKTIGRGQLQLPAPTSNANR
ncbi:right-handed parallel beta-helix repeat-containing protein [Hymenobacter sp. BT559]|uniref:right-handed parallel beta-helix repeat-containing protein n=1 Tax=Hymenobacter sp. BT559 TaxID=2795729 RepID=UPI0018EB2D59|nr:right-handed parallel beta-helix repeat-containing protein [Hymenobacter sp. BT559]MBJ6145298.1 right-handed parallel beta-helix repeat-containing protein [Hymenobacter sp. BT559]